VAGGGRLYRIGRYPSQKVTAAKVDPNHSPFTWSVENPLTMPEDVLPKKYGMNKMDIQGQGFLEVATVKPGASFVTRPAPAYGIILAVPSKSW